MRGRPPHIRDEDLLDAARDVFRKDGHGATTAKIARRAGVSEGILFYRYKSKASLLAAVIHRETKPSQALHDATSQAGRRTLAHNLERIVQELLDSVERTHPLLELIETSPDRDEILRALFTVDAKPAPVQIVETLAGYVAAEIKLGHARRVTPEVVARAIFGGCVDFVRSGHLARVKPDREAFVRGLVDLLLHGMASPGAKDR